jgi:hypothetical protein
MDGQHVETWQCTVCGLPCLLTIIASDAKLPRNLKGQYRFVACSCPCKEAIPDWKRTDNKGVTDETR